MELLKSDVESFNEKGFLLKTDVFTDLESKEILDHCKNVMKIDCERRILEKNGSVRSFFAPEFSDVFFYSINNNPKITDLAMALLESDIYVYQTKINVKQAMLGDWWKWHRDFTFWNKDDGMIRPQVLTAMIFLDDITEFNGPLLLIPGSHLSKEEQELSCQMETGDYTSALIADLKYSSNIETIKRWSEQNGIFSAKGQKGSVLFFHGNILHASSNNLSPWDRNTLMITYNSVDNKLPEREKCRPEFLARRKKIE